jgi:4-deoxy-L-threo-5-hexosulose-uronate ketol-isomerase
MTTDELRRSFALENLFAPGELRTVFVDADRAVAGGAVPLKHPLRLEPSREAMAAEYFAERREAGIVNIGGAGSVRADGERFVLGTKDMAYVGRGTRSVEFSSDDPARPAAFFLVSFPAHAAHRCAPAPLAGAEEESLGSAENANRRTIHRFIHPRGVKSCQLVMGLTDVHPGSAWNTMPPHTHLRRMEIYLYFNLAPDALVVHLMGRPRETRSLVLRDREGAVSPAWSVHCGAGTGPYSFIWAMGGENQEFADMDHVRAGGLL